MPPKKSPYKFDLQRILSERRKFSSLEDSVYAGETLMEIGSKLGITDSSGRPIEGFGWDFERAQQALLKGGAVGKFERMSASNPKFSDEISDIISKSPISKAAAYKVAPKLAGETEETLYALPVKQMATAEPTSKAATKPAPTAKPIATARAAAAAKPTLRERMLGKSPAKRYAWQSGIARSPSPGKKWPPFSTGARLSMQEQRRRIINVQLPKLKTGSKEFLEMKEELDALHASIAKYGGHIPGERGRPALERMKSPTKGGFENPVYEPSKERAVSPLPKPQVSPKPETRRVFFAQPEGSKLGFDNPNLERPMRVLTAGKDLPDVPILESGTAQEIQANNLARLKRMEEQIYEIDRQTTYSKTKRIVVKEAAEKGLRNQLALAEQRKAVIEQKQAALKQELAETVQAHELADAKRATIQKMAPVLRQAAAKGATLMAKREAAPRSPTPPPVRAVTPQPIVSPARSRASSVSSDSSFEGFSGLVDRLSALPTMGAQRPRSPTPPPVRASTPPVERRFSSNPFGSGSESDLDDYNPFSAEYKGGLESRLKSLQTPAFGRQRTRTPSLSSESSSEISNPFSRSYVAPKAGAATNIPTRALSPKVSELTKSSDIPLATFSVQQEKQAEQKAFGQQIKSSLKAQFGKKSPAVSQYVFEGEITEEALKRQIASVKPGKATKAQVFKTQGFANPVYEGPESLETTEEILASIPKTGRQPSLVKQVTQPEKPTTTAKPELTPEHVTPSTRDVAAAAGKAIPKVVKPESQFRHNLLKALQAPGKWLGFGLEKEPSYVYRYPTDELNRRDIAAELKADEYIKGIGENAIFPKPRVREVPEFNAELDREIPQAMRHPGDKKFLKAWESHGWKEPNVQAHERNLAAMASEPAPSNRFLSPEKREQQRIKLADELYLEQQKPLHKRSQAKITQVREDLKQWEIKEQRYTRTAPAGTYQKPSENKNIIWNPLQRERAPGYMPDIADSEVSSSAYSEMRKALQEHHAKGNISKSRMEKNLSRAVESPVSMLRSKQKLIFHGGRLRESATGLNKVRKALNIAPHKGYIDPKTGDYTKIDYDIGKSTLAAIKYEISWPKIRNWFASKSVQPRPVLLSSKPTEKITQLVNERAKETALKQSRMDAMIEAYERSMIPTQSDIEKRIAVMDDPAKIQATKAAAIAKQAEFDIVNAKNAADLAELERYWNQPTHKQFAEDIRVAGKKASAGFSKFSQTLKSKFSKETPKLPTPPSSPASSRRSSISSTGSAGSLRSAGSIGSAGSLVSNRSTDSTKAARLAASFKFEDTEIPVAPRVIKTPEDTEYEQRGRAMVQGFDKRISAARYAASMDEPENPHIAQRLPKERAAIGGRNPAVPGRQGMAVKADVYTEADIPPAIGQSTGRIIPSTTQTNQPVRVPEQEGIRRIGTVTRVETPKVRYFNPKYAVAARGLLEERVPKAKTPGEISTTQAFKSYVPGQTEEVQPSVSPGPTTSTLTEEAPKITTQTATKPSAASQQLNKLRTKLSGVFGRQPTTRRGGASQSFVNEAFSGEDLLADFGSATGVATGEESTDPFAGLLGGTAKRGAPGANVVGAKARSGNILQRAGLMRPSAGFNDPGVGVGAEDIEFQELLSPYGRISEGIESLPGGRRSTTATTSFGSQIKPQSRIGSFFGLFTPRSGTYTLAPSDTTSMEMSSLESLGSEVGLSTSPFRRTAVGSSESSSLSRRSSISSTGSAGSGSSRGSIGSSNAPLMRGGPGRVPIAPRGYGTTGSTFVRGGPGRMPVMRSARPTSIAPKASSTSLTNKIFAGGLALQAAGTVASVIMGGLSYAQSQKSLAMQKEQYEKAANAPRVPDDQDHDRRFDRRLGKRRVITYI